MKKMVLALAFLASATLAGCASRHQVSEAFAAKARQRITCSGAEQCTLYWRRAQAWLALNSEMKIQIATDMMLETYNPVNHNPVYGFRIMRIPDAGQTERIMIHMSCGNLLGCSEPRELVTVRFMDYVREGM